MKNFSNTKGTTRRWHRVITVALIALLTMTTLTACGANSTTSSTSKPSTSSSESSKESSKASSETSKTESSKETSTASSESSKSEIANPFVVYDSWEKLTTAAGVTYPEPATLPEGYTTKEISLMESGNKFGQIIYTSKTDASAEITYRVSNTVTAAELNGDNNTYADKKTITVGDISVSCQGTDGKFSVATWTNGEFNYCIMSATPLTENQLTEIISGIK